MLNLLDKSSSSAIFLLLPVDSEMGQHERIMFGQEVGPFGDDTHRLDIILLLVYDVCTSLSHQVNDDATVGKMQASERSLRR